MTRTRNMADLLDSNGDVKSAALDNTSSDLVDDTTPQLGGNLDLNSNNITGTGDISVTGDFDASGSVGIGETSPASKLTIGGNSNYTAKPTVQVTDTTNGGSMTLRGQSPKLQFDITNSGTPKILMDGAGLQFKTGTLDAEGDVDVAITSGGGLAIGSDTASTNIHVNVGGTASRRIRLQNTEGSADYGTDANRAIIYVAGNQKARIDSGGRMYLNGEGGSVAGIDVQQGLAKAWGSLEQSGTHSFRDSHNMSSIADQGTGISRITMNNAMNNSNYATVGCSGEQAGGGNRVMGLRGSSVAPNTTRFDIANFALSTGSSSDDTRISIAVLGDKA